MIIYWNFTICNSVFHLLDSVSKTTSEAKPKSVDLFADDEDEDEGSLFGETTAKKEPEPEKKEEKKEKNKKKVKFCSYRQTATTTKLSLQSFQIGRGCVGLISSVHWCR